MKAPSLFPLPRLARLATLAGLLPALSFGAATGTSDWSTDGLKILVSVNGGTAQPFFARGVCYCAAPLNDLGDLGTPFQDFFYYRAGPATDVGTKGYTPIWMRDIGTSDKPGFLRKLGVNSIRTYALMKHPYAAPHPPNDWSWKEQYADYAKLDWSTNPPASDAWWVHDGHDLFLDLCWNNGKDPIYVWIGVPFAGDPFGYGATPEARTRIENAYQFFLKTCEWLAKRYGKHPAVMGFILGNEHDAEAGLNGPKIEKEHPRELPPPGDWGPDYVMSIEGTPLQSLGNGKYQGMPAGVYWRTDYWDKLNSMYDVIKQNAPGKLVTVALHDKPRAAAHWLAKADDIGKTITLIDKPVWDYAKMDVLSYNIYRDPQDALGEYATTYIKWLKDTNRYAKVKPILFTEMGIPASDRVDDAARNDMSNTQAIEQANNAKAQSDILVRQWTQMFANRSDGGTGSYPYVAGGYIFAYVDEWFKDGTPGVHNGRAAGMAQSPGKHWDDEWFGIMRAKASPNRKFSQDVTQNKREQSTSDPPELRPVINEWTGDLNGGPDTLEPRAAYTDLIVVFSKNSGSPSQSTPAPQPPQNSGPQRGASGAGDFLSN